MEKIPINQFLIEQIDNFTSKGEPFENAFETQEIVPTELRHQNLFHSKTDRLILDYYLQPTANIKKKPFVFFNDDIENQIPFTDTYIRIPFGVYFRIDVLKDKFTELLKGEGLYEHTNLKYLKDLDPYFKKYSEGFRVGFDSFYDDKIRPHLLFKDDRKGIMNLIFDFVRNGWERSYYSMHRDGFRTFSAYDSGKLEGYIYRAWSHILPKDREFRFLFKELQNRPEFQSSTLPKKAGRKKIKTKDPEYYFIDFEIQENKEKFLTAIKSKYKEASPATMVYLIKALLEIGRLKEASNKEYRESFEKLLECAPTTSQNFDNHFKNEPDKIKINRMKLDLNKIIQDNAIV